MRSARVATIALVVLVLTGGTALVAHAAWHTLDSRWAWQRADLDRNRLSLGQYRGAETGEALAGWVENGEVVDSGGRSVVGKPGSEATVVVRYQQGPTSWDQRVDVVCYRFSMTAGNSVAFAETRCPAR